MHPRSLFVAVLLAAAVLVDLPRAQVVRDLGQISFPNSGAPEAQEPFVRGVLLLHSFEYDDAAEAFREAQAADADFALAYWGEALTHSHPIWAEDDPEAARAILARLAPSLEERAALAPTERERGLLATVEALWGEGERVERNRRYSEALAALHERFPDDHEVASFYALSILGTSAGGRDQRLYMRAASVAEEVYHANPRHPGALHYLIHSYDDPVHAPLGLRMARTYAEVAPAAAHALHMPSHIFVALGMWDASAASNEDSAAAADARRARKELPVEERGFHSLWWLAYSYLQQGRQAEARELLVDMQRDYAEGPSRRTAYHLARMRAEFLVHTGAWPVDMTIDEGVDWLRTFAIDAFARGWKAVQDGDLAAAERVVQDLHQRRVTRAERESGIQIDLGGIGCCLPADAAGAYDLSAAERNALILEQELLALIHRARGETIEALTLLRDAARNADAEPFDFGPPDAIKPVHELLGELYLELERPVDARLAFEQALLRAPRRTLSLLGLARAASAAAATAQDDGRAETRGDDRAAAREAYGELAAILVRADEGLALAAEVRAAGERRTSDEAGDVGRARPRRAGWSKDGR